MKHTHTCPKCEGKRIVCGEDSNSGALAISAGTLKTPVKVLRYLCLSCGYLESFVEEPDLIRLRKKYDAKK